MKTKLSEKQRRDIALLEYAITLIRSGGSLKHVIVDTAAKGKFSARSVIK